jgi:hypothetical protein
MTNNMQNTHNNYDIIGDIHGHATTLLCLLETLDYSLDDEGVYHHKERKAVFLGDFIDRGSEESKVINIVKPMIEKGYALAVMGNHEFNAICYHTDHPETGEPLRQHSDKNTKGHKAFLAEYPLKGKKTKEAIEWFKTLPLFIELDNFRVIHACWNQGHFDFIKPLLDIDNTLTDDLYIKASNKGSKEYDAIEVLLKGLEIPLPNGSSFKDKDGHTRTDIRIKWWKEDAKTYQDYAQVPEDQLDNIPHVALSGDVSNPEYPKENKPVFVGHYWFSGAPEILRSNVACLDYSIANKEKLVCYRWNNGDTSLSNTQFIHVDWTRQA